MLVDNSGAYFVVVIHGDIVVKIPRIRHEKNYRDKLHDLHMWQNELAEKCDGILPCTFMGTHIEMQCAPGARCDVLYMDKDNRKWLERKRKELERELKGLGCDVNDNNWKNYFWDGERMYLVDLHLAKRVGT